jgi:hypothetical protein
MERFTRECLQVDSEASSSGDSQKLFSYAAMERIYSRAADLVKQTLDVEGACVMDVSRSGLHEPSSSSEGQLAVTSYHAGNSIASDNKVLASEDFADVVTFFTKQPDGVIVDDAQFPPWLKEILPQDTLHALSENLSTLSIVADAGKQSFRSSISIRGRLHFWLLITQLGRAKTS